ncbi:MAG: sigma-70 family RNA polymerase sigma factor [Sedimentisphaerales bacterium]|nr:sigma-70 family RNA polymerase sigma factor [Sedimentisphaerales bacterium]
MLEDRLLIWKLRRGSIDALRRIYDKYKVDLLKLAIALTDDVCRSEDAVQDVFLKLVESYERIDIHGSLKSYLTACLVNRVRTLHRTSRRHETDVSLDPAVVRIPGSDPEEGAVLNEEMRRVSEALAQLPPEQREVVMLRVDARLGFRQIARIQSASLYTVQGRYRYGMRRLRSLLNGEETL